MTKRPTAFIGMETSGEIRRRMAQLGFLAVSCDTLPAEDGVTFSGPASLETQKMAHIQGDVFETLEMLKRIGAWPDLAVFHPTCTYLTSAAEWAFKEPDFERYPGVGYHQRLATGTLFGKARREARQDAISQFLRISELEINIKLVENPVGALSRVTKPSQVVQPYCFGDNASKATCLWAFDKRGQKISAFKIPIDPNKRVTGRFVNGKELWDNQTDSGQNRLSPGADRWKDRSRTFPGIANAVSSYLKDLLEIHQDVESLV